MNGASSRAAVHVYFIEAGPGGPVKIGRAVNPWERIMTLQVANHLQLSMLFFAACPKAPIVERWLHGMLRQSCVRGEWFERTSSVEQAMKRFRKGLVVYRGTKFHVDVDLVYDAQLTPPPQGKSE